MITDMIMGFVSSMLGPSGMKILDWYIQNGLFVNGFIVAMVLLYIIFPKQGKRIVDKFREIYLKSPLAPDEKERAAIEKVKALRESKKAGRTLK
jgi:hypothetical protein